ncbi:MAG: alpha/beta hydrolase [Sandaracinaceae bacterium]
MTALTALVAGGAIYYKVAQPDSHQMAAVFSGDVPTSWPPPSQASLETELEHTEAMQRLGATGLAPDGYRPDAGVPGHVPGLQVRTGEAAGLFYIEAVFGRGAQFESTMPMAVLIHGRGDRARIPGGPFWGLSSPIRVIVPQAPDPLGDGFEWLPVRVGSGLFDRLTTSLMARSSHVARFLREMQERVPTAGRPMVVGFSQGGLLTLALAVHHSDVVSAAFPLAAWLPPALVPQYRREDVVFPRIRSVHGRADRIIPLRPTQEVFDSLEGAGFEVELVPFDGVEHTMSADMNAQLHSWLDEALTGVVQQSVEDGLLDGGVPPCPDAGSPDAGRPDAAWLDGGIPEAGVDGGLDFDDPCAPRPISDAGPLMDAGPGEAEPEPESFLRDLDY